MSSHFDLVCRQVLVSSVLLAGCGSERSVLIDTPALDGGSASDAADAAATLSLRAHRSPWPSERHMTGNEVRQPTGSEGPIELRAWGTQREDWLVPSNAMIATDASAVEFAIEAHPSAARAPRS